MTVRTYTARRETDMVTFFKAKKTRETCVSLVVEV
jgi:hypothetical protein